MNKKNHFDSKDMILLIIVLIVIYTFISWFGNNGEVFDESYYGTQQTQETSVQK